MVNYTQPTMEQKYNLKNNMKTRCYNANYYKIWKNYEGCSICDEWLEDKKSFYEWVDHNYYVIKGEPSVELDKDIIVPGNKVYSPDTCIFVPKRINDLFEHIHGRKKNGLPVGVSYSERTGKYSANVSKSYDSKDGKNKNRYLGCYDVSAKYCYVTHELRLHQNDRCKRFTLF